MKTQLIILENKLFIINDDFVSANTLCYSIKGKTIFKPDEYDNLELVNISCQKIIAGLENQPIIDYSVLSDEDCEKIGYINVENYSKLEFPPDFNVQGDELDYYERMAFIKGFKKAQSLNDKKFSLEDIFKILDLHTDEAPISYLKSELSKSLQQPKVFDIEVEMERTRYPKDDDGWEDIYNPKITNNSIKITKVL